MAKILRKLQKIFGMNAAGTQRSVFGSAAAGDPAYTTDPATIQSANYEGGWFTALVANRSSFIQDMNSLHFLYGYQLAYLMQSGIAEWDAQTTYYIGSIVSDGSGSIYKCLINDTIGVSLSDSTYWVRVLTSEITASYYNSTTRLVPNGVSKAIVDVYINTVKKLAAGNGFGAAIDPNGAAYAWGLNTNGQLGVGDVLPRSTPVLILGGKSWRQIEMGASFSVGIEAFNGATYLWSWGLNNTGQLGLGDLIPRSTPTLIAGIINPVMVAAGWGSAYAITASGDLYAWGTNTSGQLGTGATNPFRSTPTLVVGAYKWKWITAGFDNAYGVTLSGNLMSWGNGVNGSLGNGASTGAVSSPTLIGGAFTWRTVSAGAPSRSAIAINTLGAAYSWGENTNGQLGLGDRTHRSSPVLIPGGRIWRSMQSSNSCFAQDYDGNIFSWGANAAGQLAQNDVTPRSTPTLVNAIYGIFSSIAVNDQTAYGVKNSGELFAWGSGASGSLGDTTVISKSTPVLVSGGIIMSVLFTVLRNKWTLPVIAGQELVLDMYPSTSAVNNTNVYQRSTQNYGETVVNITYGG